MEDQSRFRKQRVNRGAFDLTKAKKKLILQEYLSSNCTKASIAEKYGITVFTLNNWIRRNEDGKALDQRSIKNKKNKYSRKVKKIEAIEQVFEEEEKVNHAELLRPSIETVMRFAEFLEDAVTVRDVAARRLIELIPNETNLDRVTNAYKAVNEIIKTNTAKGTENNLPAATESIKTAIQYVNNTYNMNDSILKTLLDQQEKIEANHQTEPNILTNGTKD